MQRRDNGMGTIYQRENGTWVGRIKEKGKDGKTKYKCFSGKSQAEVKRKIRDYNKQSDTIDQTEVSLLKIILIYKLLNQQIYSKSINH